MAGLVSGWYRRAGVVPHRARWPTPCATPVPRSSSTTAPPSPKSNASLATPTSPPPRCTSKSPGGASKRRRCPTLPGSYSGGTKIS